MVVLLFVPAITVIGIALTDWQFGARTFEFIGLQNFEHLLGDRLFWQSTGNTLLYVVIMVPGSVLLGLMLAVVIDSGLSARSLYRSVFFLPVMATMAAMAIAWQMVLHPSLGLISHLLQSVGLPPQRWLYSESGVIPALAAIGIWQQAGFNMVLFIAGLRVIPRELYDAAAVDGWQGPVARFSLVTLPMLGPVLMFVAVITTIRAFQVFDTVAVLTEGGPRDHSEVMLYTIYREGFEFYRTGYAASMAVVFLVVIVGLTLLQARYFDRRVHYS
ncbi:MAG: sugar ABC transporter permease [Pseudomonadota bacterium]